MREMFYVVGVAVTIIAAAKVYISAQTRYLLQQRVDPTEDSRKRKNR